MFSLRPHTLVRALALAAGITAAGFASAAPVLADQDGCLAPEFDLAHPAANPPFTAGQIALYEESLKSKDIVGLRAAITAYLHGTADDTSTKSLAKIPNAVLAQPIDLYNDGSAPGGSRLLSIFFEGHHNNMVVAMVAPIGTSTDYDVLATAVVSCTDAQKDYLLGRYKPFYSAGGA